MDRMVGVAKMVEDEGRRREGRIGMAVYGWELGGELWDGGFNPFPNPP